MRSSFSRGALKATGGVHFVNVITEAFLTLHFNVAKLGLHIIEHNLDNRSFVDLQAHATQHHLFQIFEDGREFQAKDGGNWVLSDLQLAKMWYMYASCLRLR